VTFRREDNHTTSSSSVRFRLAMLFLTLRLILSFEGLSQPIGSSTDMDSKLSRVSIDVMIYSNLGSNARRNLHTISSLYSHLSTVS
jgi:hypothetical protein